MTRVSINRFTYERQLKEHLEELEEAKNTTIPGRKAKNKVDYETGKYSFGDVGCKDFDGVDYDFHQVGETWEDANTLSCNKKTCVAHDTIKEEKCPEIKDADVPEGCRVLKRDGTHGFRYDFPYCCDKVVCPGDADFSESEEPVHVCRHKNRKRQLGEQWADMGKCHKNTCKKYGIIETEKCAKLKIPKGCNITDPDLDKEFPACCPVLDCPIDHPLHPDNKDKNTTEQTNKQEKDEEDEEDEDKNQMCVIL